MTFDEPWYAFQDDQGMWRVSDGTVVSDEGWKKPQMAEFRALKLNLTVKTEKIKSCR